MGKLLQGEELSARAKELGIPTTRVDVCGISRAVDEIELQRRVREVERESETDARDFESYSPVISAALPRDEKGLETRLERLFEYLAKHATSDSESSESVLTKARIEQVKQKLSWYEGRRVSTREWLAFGLGAAGLIIAALAVILK